MGQRITDEQSRLAAEIMPLIVDCVKQMKAFGNSAEAFDFETMLYNAITCQKALALFLDKAVQITKISKYQ